jgi:hypothetical protein
LPKTRPTFPSRFSVGAGLEPARLNLRGKPADRGTLKFILQFGKVIPIWGKTLNRLTSYPGRRVLPHTKKLKNIRFRCYRKCTFYKTNTALFLFHRVFKLTGDTGLAESAAATADPVVIFNVLQVKILVIAAFYLVVAGFRDGTGGAAGDTGFAAFVYII